MSGVPYPKRIRRTLDHYANRDLHLHVTFHAHPEIAHLPEHVPEAIWQAVIEQNTIGRVELFAACLMPDHLHLLLRPAAFDAVRFADTWKSYTTRRAWECGHRGPLWQPGMWDRTIRDQADFDTTVEYVLRNPVEAGLVTDPREWPQAWAWYWDG
jgi:REP element-mobilizing transposase RayT